MKNPLKNCTAWKRPWPESRLGAGLLEIVRQVVERDAVPAALGDLGKR